MLKHVVIRRNARRRREALKHYSLYMTLLLFKRWIYLSVDREYEDDLYNLHAVLERLRSLLISQRMYHSRRL